MNQVPLLDIVAQNQPLWAELQPALESVMSQAQFVLGPAVERFEQNFARYLGAKHAVGVNNGTSALLLALQGLDIGPGDEVITTPLTWISTSWAISYLGARPVFVDVDPVSYNLDPELVENAITPRTKALLPVHLYGQSANLTQLASLAERHGLTLVEDAAQAHGAMHGGRRVGTIGRAGCFSFYPGKNLGALGEAGAIVTDDEQLAQRLRSLRDHAQRGRHHHVEIGYNARMEGLQGAALDVKLRYLDRWNATRSLHAERYHDLLSDCPHLTLPRLGSLEEHVWHLFVVLVRDVPRETLRQALGELGVATGVHYPTLVPFQPVYAGLGYRPGDFPIAEHVARHCLSLPMFPELTEAQIEHVAESLWELLSDPHRLASGSAALPSGGVS
ncbi:MAG: DegT/DnrJ/EryC1/StrS family aminotransferase [Pirellulaceae bacterium]